MKVILIRLHCEVDMGISEKEGGIKDDSQVSGLTNKELAPFIYCDKGREETRENQVYGFRHMFDLTCYLGIRKQC